MNKPREGNRPGLPSSTLEPEKESKNSLVRLMESGLAEPTRDTGRNRFLARQNGWTDEQYNHWVDTGDPPIRSVIRETPATRDNEIDDDERLHQ